MKKNSIAIIGLLGITVLSALQYYLLLYIPDQVSDSFFLFLTNLIGMLILGIFSFKKVLMIKKATLYKGAILAIELLGCKIFMNIGTQNMDPVLASNVISLYFIFVAPILLLLKKKVNFFSGIATVVASIGIILMFGGDYWLTFSQWSIFYLILSDLFFAAFVVSISIFTEGENTVQLTFAHLAFSAFLSLVFYGAEFSLGKAHFYLPLNWEFWLIVLFFGIAIRMVYSLVLIQAQKVIPAVNTSLIIAGEIILVMFIGQFVDYYRGSGSAPIRLYQLIGAVLVIVALISIDGPIMKRLGFRDLDIQIVKNEKGELVHRSSVSRKMIFSTLMFTMITLVVSTIICLYSIYFIRDSAIDNSATLGIEASESSEKALKDEAEMKLMKLAQSKSDYAEARLDNYSNDTMNAAEYAVTLYENRESYPAKPVEKSHSRNKGDWMMQCSMADESRDYESYMKENALLGNMEAIFAPIVKHNSNIATIYIGTENGLMISYDTYSSGDLYYEYRNSVWYQLGKKIETGKYAFTEIYHDHYGRGPTITCVAPIRDSSGRFYGCVAMDILMEDLNEELVSHGISGTTQATIIDENGNIIASKDIKPLKNEFYNIFNEDVHSNLREIGEEIITKRNGITHVGAGNDAAYVAYADVESTGWIFCISRTELTVLAPSQMIKTSIEDSTSLVIDSVSQGVATVVQSCLILSAVILLTVTICINLSSHRISDPLKKLEEDVRKISGGNLEQRTNVDTNDEIGILAHSFNNMTDSLQKYIVELKEATAKEERIASELSVATRIQTSMLPSDFPAFPERTDFHVYATMHPAKEVGGDFYDFFLIDATHIALVMADVSGKGVPAAMFMTVAKTLIKNRVLMGGSPSEVLADVNEQLCDRNEEGMFVTVWLAILDLKTGKGIEANAGHEHPVIRRKDSRYELNKYRHSPAIGTMDGIRFRESEFELRPGDRLFVYTDGVPEAINSSDEMFGTERLLEALNTHESADLTEMLSFVKQEIDLFAEGVEQFDDETMLGFDYFGL